MAPKGPVAVPKVRGNEKIPEPTIDPTTIPVRAKRGSFCIAGDAVACGAVDAVAWDVMALARKTMSHITLGAASAIETSGKTLVSPDRNADGQNRKFPSSASHVPMGI
jgi:hypothetical protein